MLLRQLSFSMAEDRYVPFAFCGFQTFSVVFFQHLDRQRASFDAGRGGFF